MKSIVITLTLIAVMLGGTSVAVADDTKVSLGLKVWSNSWEEEAEYSDGTSETFDMGSSVMVGPSLSVRFPSNWFIGASYLTTTKDYESSDWIFVGDSMSLERKDLDLMLGYMFNPRFGVFFGYKTIDAPMTYSDPISGYNNVDFGSMKLSGPGVGILGNIPIGDTTAIYGSLALMFMELEQTLSAEGAATINAIAGLPVVSAGSSTKDSTGASLEIGLAFAFTHNLSANIGIKAQSFVGEEDEDGDTYTDSFSGLTAGLTYTF